MRIAPPSAPAVKPATLGVVAIVVIVCLVLMLRHSSHTEPVPSAPTPPPVAIHVSPVTVPSPTVTPLPVETPLSAPTATPGVMPTRDGATTKVEIVEATLCQSVDMVGRPVDPTTQYGPTQAFFCSARVKDIQVGTEIVAFWQMANGRTSSTSTKSEKKGYFYVFFTVRPPNGGWPTGKCRLNLIVDGVLKKTLDFEVAGASPSPGAASPAPASHVEEAVTCKSVDPRSRRPVQATTDFAAGDTFNVAVRVRDVTQGRTILTKWYHNDKDFKDVSMQIPHNGSGWLSFQVSSKDKWPSGNYKVEVYYEGGLTRTENFTVHP